MPRAFQLTVTANADLAFQDRVTVEDGDDVRFHDVAIVLERLLAAVRQRGSDRVPTRSQVLAEQAKIDAANKVLADWEETADAVNTTIILGGATSFSRTWRKRGYTEIVEAPCDNQGRPTLETAAKLETWEPPMAEAK